MKTCFLLAVLLIPVVTGCASSKDYLALECDTFTLKFVGVSVLQQKKRVFELQVTPPTGNRKIYRRSLGEKAGRFELTAYQSAQSRGLGNFRQEIDVLTVRYGGKSIALPMGRDVVVLAVHDPADDLRCEPNHP